MVKIAIGLITAPRHKPTVNRMLSGLRYVNGIPHVNIFAEPLSDVPKFDGQTIHQHETVKGCFGNFDHAYKWLLQNTDADYLLVLSDDMKFKPEWYKQALKVLSQINDEKMGYVALYTPRGGVWAFPKNPRPEIVKLNRGWGKGLWGGLYVIPRKAAEKIVNSDYYLDYKKTNKTGKHFDELMKEACLRLDLNQYYLNPSLFDHVGETSTIGHTFRSMDKGLNYGRTF